MMMFGIVGLAQANPIITNGLVAAYEFNGNANDSSGNGNDGIVNGASLATDRHGNTNSAYSFNAANDNYISFNDSPSLDQTVTDAITVSAWVNFDNFGTNANARGQTILGKWGGSGPVAYILYRDMREGVPYNRLFWNINNDINTMVSIPFPIGEHQWFNVVGTADSSGVNLYINSELVAIGNAGVSQINATANNLKIGYEDTGPSPFNGMIDSVYIYNRAISSTEVKALYNESLAVPEPSTMLLFGAAIAGFVRSRQIGKRGKGGQAQL